MFVNTPAMGLKQKLCLLWVQAAEISRRRLRNTESECDQQSDSCNVRWEMKNNVDNEDNISQLRNIIQLIRHSLETASPRCRIFNSTSMPTNCEQLELFYFFPSPSLSCWISNSKSINKPLQKTKPKQTTKKLNKPPPKTSPIKYFYLCRIDISPNFMKVGLLLMLVASFFTSFPCNFCVFNHKFVWWTTENVKTEKYIFF